MFFLRVGKDALNGLRTQRVGFLAKRRMPKVLRAFYVVVPDMARYGLCTLLIFGAAFADRTVFANVAFAFVLPVAIAIGGGIAQNLVLRAEDAVVIFIVDIFVLWQVPTHICAAACISTGGVFAGLSSTAFPSVFFSSIMAAGSLSRSVVIAQGNLSP